MINQRVFKYCRKQAGLSLVELMVALLLSSMLLFGVVQIFETNKRSSTLINSFSRVQENGRIAMEVLARDIRMAGHWGCSSDFEDIKSHHSEYDEWADMQGISGEDDVGSGEAINSIEIKPGTDTITIAGASRRYNVTIEPPFMPDHSQPVHVTSGVDIPEGEVLLVSDCTYADIFENTHNNTAGGGNIQHDDPLLTVYESDAQILSPEEKQYFVGRSSGSDPWSLYVRDLKGNTSQLIRDVDDLQITYGVATSDNCSVDQFADAGEVATTAGMDMGMVISVDARLTMNGDVVEGEVFSRDYSVTSNIRNRSLKPRDPEQDCDTA